MPPIISPSLLSADFSNLRQDIELINKSRADWFHLDIMDGVFVPNISFGFPVISAVKRFATKPLDVHLMIVEPDKFIDDFKKAGADILTVHYEVCPHLHRTVQRIKAAGMMAGVSLNPHTPVHLLEDILSELDMVLIMSVNPGFGGQSFIPGTLRKISKLRSMADSINPKLIIQVDGGIGTGNCAEVVASGANSLVAGSAIFGAEDPLAAIDQIKGW